ncbi:MAG: HEAT repeat domain-containing protein [bacterium]|nr:HEAT repeat domain-containing protein [bacterium]
MRKSANSSFVVFAFGLILMTMFLWISHTFKRTQVEEISADVKKEIWRQIGLLETICISTNDMAHILDRSKPQIFYFRFVGKPSAPMLIKVLSDKKRDWKLRFIIIQLLSKMETELPLVPLITILKDETEMKNIRVASCLALGTLKFDEVIPPLMETAKDNDQQLQSAAIYALGELRKEQIVDELNKWQDEEKDVRIKKELESAIEKFRD